MGNPGATDLTPGSATLHLGLMLPSASLTTAATIQLENFTRGVVGASMFVVRAQRRETTRSFNLGFQIADFGLKTFALRAQREPRASAEAAATPPS
jgi:hypothetical protein